MTQPYEVIVIGLGAMGSAAAAHLSGRGLRVLGLDMYQPMHDQGSSHGQTRIIREAYFEAPEYVPLVQRAYALWRELEEITGRSLLTITGGLNLGTPASALVRGAERSAQVHHLPYERLSAAEVMFRFPAYRLPEDFVAVYEPRAGYLHPEESVAAHLELAARHGAELHHQEEVLRWQIDGEGVRVETSRALYSAARLVITPGPWASELLADLRIPIVVRRIVLAHFEPRERERFTPDRMPVYLWEVPEGTYYGFPALPGQGMKVGRHDIGEMCTPRTIRRTVDTGEVEALRAVLDSYLPGAGGDLLRTVTCMYTNTPDLHFVIDRHPRYPQVSFACGFSGHGFKFASVIGELIADISITGRSRFDIEFLSLSRFSGRRER